MSEDRKTTSGTVLPETDYAVQYTRTLMRGRHLYQRQVLLPQMQELQERCRKVENLLVTDYADVLAAFDELKNLVDALTEHIETELQQEGDELMTRFCSDKHFSECKDRGKPFCVRCNEQKHEPLDAPTPETGGAITVADELGREVEVL